MAFEFIASPLIHEGILPVYEQKLSSAKIIEALQTVIDSTGCTTQANVLLGPGV